MLSGDSSGRSDGREEDEEVETAAVAVFNGWSAGVAEAATRAPRRRRRKGAACFFFAEEGERGKREKSELVGVDFFSFASRSADEQLPLAAASVDVSFQSRYSRSLFNLLLTSG